MKRKAHSEAKKAPKKERGAAPTGPNAWQALGLTERIASQVATMGFAAPTAVQKRAVPAALRGSDLMFRARTGSGKTLAYLLPLAQCLYDQRLTRADGTIAFILAPTRELATQIFGVATNLLKPFHWLLCTSITGGENRKAEKARLRKGVTVVIGTPGRLLDHVRHTAAWKISGVQMIVLDEADRLVELGQEEDVQAILKAIQDAKKTAGKEEKNEGDAEEAEEVDNTAEAEVEVEGKGKRKHVARAQGILTSATLAPSAAPLKRLSGLLLQSPQFIDESGDLDIQKPAAAAKLEPPPVDIAPPMRGANVHHEDSDSEDAGKNDNAGEEGEEEEEEEAEDTQSAPAITGEEGQFSVPATLTQHFTVVPARLRLLVLLGFLRAQAAKAKTGAGVKVLLFTNTTAGVDFHALLLGSILGSIATVTKLHGSMEMPERKVTVRSFSAPSATPLTVLVATDVAARGLDFGHIDTVLLYDPPTAPVDYIHRIGRTARAGRHGDSHIFLLPSESEYVQQVLVNQLGLMLQKDRLAPYLIAALGNAGAPAPRETDSEAFLFWAEKATRGAQISLENAALPHITAAKTAFRAAVRAYATFPKNLRHIFQLGKLHLGHLARSFALRDAPSKLKEAVSKKQRKVHVHGAKRREASSARSGKGGPQRKRRADVSEFGV